MLRLIVFAAEDQLLDLEIKQPVAREFIGIGKEAKCWCVSAKGGISARLPSSTTGTLRYFFSSVSPTYTMRPLYSTGY